MSESQRRLVSQKFSCPGCASLLRFKRIPTQLVQSCPNCRRLLRLHDQIVAAETTQDFDAAIGKLAAEAAPAARKVAYDEDPRLDRFTRTDSGVLRFDQPWPEEATEVVLEGADVNPNPFDIQSVMIDRRQLLNGFHRRVTMERTGEVEEIAVIGHWRSHTDGQMGEAVVGWLPRPVVRDLNRLPYTMAYAARINSAWRDVEENREVIKLRIDIAMAPSKSRPRKPRRIR